MSKTLSQEELTTHMSHQQTVWHDYLVYQSESFVTRNWNQLWLNEAEKETGELRELPGGPENQQEVSHWRQSPKLQITRYPHPTSYWYGTLPLAPLHLRPRFCPLTLCQSLTYPRHPIPPHSFLDQSPGESKDWPNPADMPMLWAQRGLPKGISGKFKCYTGRLLYLPLDS